MPYNRKTKKVVLGKNLIHSRIVAKNKTLKNSTRHTQDVGDGYDYATFSITEENSLKEFFVNAEINKKQFQAERQNVKLIDPNNIGLLNEEKLNELSKKHAEHKKILCIPRRPMWTCETTNEDLQNLEYNEFIEWRKKLADVAKEKDLIFTPFEKNLEFWRQLWRVLERSDLIVQIVDARNPLIFYCQDIHIYTEELSKHKENIVLVNKSDFLNGAQRKHWANYFNSLDIKAIFFSALEQTDIYKEKLKNKIKNEIRNKKKSDENFLNLKELNENNFNGEEYEDNEEYKDNNEEDEEKNQNEENALNRIENLEIQDDFDIDMFDEYLLEGRLFNRNDLVKVFQKYKIDLKNNLPKDFLTIGLVGYPNVGKSSTINSLIECKKVSISSTPGKTKHFQTIFLDKELCLCDCPGLVFPNFVTSKAEMFLNGILPIDQIKDYKPSINLLAQKIPLRVFQSVYSLVVSSKLQEKDYLTGNEILNSYSLMKGFVTGRGLPDHAKAAKCLIKDLICGKLLYCYSPPNLNQKLYQPYDECVVKYIPKNLTPNQQKVLNETISKEAFDKEYFKSKLTSYQIKGVNGISKNELNLNLESKPWRELNKLKRNKREKLRRVFRHLDEH